MAALVSTHNLVMALKAFRGAIFKPNEVQYPLDDALEAFIESFA